MEIIDVLNLKLGEVQDHSMIVVKITHGITDMSEVKVMCEHLGKIAAKYENIDVLVIGQNMTLEICPESHMNKLGWFKLPIQKSTEERKIQGQK